MRGGAASATLGAQPRGISRGWRCGEENLRPQIAGILLFCFQHLSFVRSLPIFIAAARCVHASTKSCPCLQASAAFTPAAAAAGQAADPPPELRFDDSSVRRYVCELATAGGSSACSGGLPGDAGAISDAAQISGFRQLPGCLADPALAHAYSIDWRPGLVVVRCLPLGGTQSAPCQASQCGLAPRPGDAGRLCAAHACAKPHRLGIACTTPCSTPASCAAAAATSKALTRVSISPRTRLPAPTRAHAAAHSQAGGKDGVVSVFGSRQLEAGQLPADASLPPLLSGKLHRGWVAEVQLLSGAGLQGASGSTSADSAGDAAGLRLLTAGNDGVVCLWDLSRSAEAGGRGGLVPECLARAAGLHQGEVSAALLPAHRPDRHIGRCSRARI